ncbi:MAG: hypothetical protein ABI700_10910 [Chloroflexota bacterium]
MMRKWFRGFGLIISLLVLAGCGDLNSFIRGMYTTPNLRVTTATYDGVIFTIDNAENAGLNIFDRDIEHYWMPNADDVADLETRLIPYLNETIPEGDWRYGIADSLSGYKRQYIGALKATDPYIWANFFCTEDIGDWQNQVIFVEDGGQCFFNVWYNVTTHEFSDLQVNGFA